MKRFSFVLLAVIAGILFDPGSQANAQVTGSAANPDSVEEISRRHRASWLGDNRPLRVGDLITVVLNEETSARERVSRSATDSRSKSASFDAGADGESVVGKTGFNSGLDSNSREVGEMNRQGDLNGIITVRVLEIDASGIAKISGSKLLVVEGREQEVTVDGFIRPIDVGPTRIIDSNRIADAKITYRGKKLGPRGGIIGRIISMLWP